MSRIRLPIVFAAVFIMVAASVAISFSVSDYENKETGSLPEYTITGETDLPGNFFISFVYTKNIIMMDGKGEIVWSMHKDAEPRQGTWDFKKHIIDGKTYYSYHDQTSSDNYGLEGYAPGERVILDENFNEVKRITFEKSEKDTLVNKGHLADGHDFYLFDLDHYIISGYLKDRVYNIPGYPDGSNVIYSYLQEVDHGNVVWEWRSIDYPEIYSLTVTDATPTANDFANVQVDAPDYVHFNAMRVDNDGNLVCSFRHLDTIMCLDRTKSTDQIIWKLSGLGDQFNLTDDQKTSGQHYLTLDGDYIMVFNNGNNNEQTTFNRYKIDASTMQLLDMRTYSVPDKFTSACGSVQHLYDEVYMIGWGHPCNDYVCMSVYDFAEDKELISMTLDNSANFTYRCVYYE